MHLLVEEPFVYTCTLLTLAPSLCEEFTKPLMITINAYITQVPKCDQIEVFSFYLKPTELLTSKIYSDVHFGWQHFIRGYITHELLLIQYH